MEFVDKKTGKQLDLRNTNLRGVDLSGTILRV